MAALLTSAATSATTAVRCNASSALHGIAAENATISRESQDERTLRIAFHARVGRPRCNSEPANAKIHASVAVAATPVEPVIAAHTVAPAASYASTVIHTSGRCACSG